jgi:6,7-dimethyl-8-ribityllumazine synthase
MKEIKAKLQAKNKKIAIVASSFNEFISKELVNSCSQTLSKCGVEPEDITVFWVPGAYEMPLVVKKAASGKKYDAIVCLGAIIRGDTPHFEYIASSVARGINQVGLETGLPVIFGVITADTQEQALERSGIKQGNKGRDAAFSVVELIDLISKIN